MRGIQVLPIYVILAAMVGCGPKANPKLAGQRLEAYGRLAIVCVPGKGADPKYVDVIITPAERMAPSRLSFLSKVDFPKDISVDAATLPPTLKLSPKVSAYNAIAALVYSYKGGVVYLDIYMIDTKSGKSVWHYQFATRDSDIRHRLGRHGYWTPTRIKSFYQGK